MACLRAWTLVCLGLVFGANGEEQAASLDAEYCIIGAGPSGVQLGHFFHEAGRSYIIFEKGKTAGNFFSSKGRNLPVHRRLISINKRTTNSNNSEFNMRHDWNSLLGDHIPRVPTRTNELYPTADVVADYVHEFAGPQIEAGRILFNTAVSRVERHKRKGSEELDFTVVTSRGNASCEILVVAAGFQTAVKMDAYQESLENLYGYETLPSLGEDHFDGKTVAVLGGGNAAFETVESLTNYAKVIIYHRLRHQDWKVTKRKSDPEAGKEVHAQGTRFAMMTHYVGDVRAHRQAIFDAYQLKQVDSIQRFPVEDAVRTYPCFTKKLCIFMGEADKVGMEDSHAVGEPFGEEKHAAVKGFLSKYQDQFGIPESNFTVKTNPEDKYGHGGFQLEVSSHVLEKDSEFLSRFLEATNLSMAEDPMVVDALVRCYGWKVDLSLFDAKTVPVQTSHKGKYPLISDTYETNGVKGLYFGGTLAHSLDFRKSAGGFIHGFRYSLRSLFRYFEEGRHGVPWPSQSLDFGGAAGVEDLASHIIDRWNNAAGPYQMFGGSLLDGIVLEKSQSSGCDASSNTCPSDGSSSAKSPITAKYFDEMPPSYMFKKCQQNPCIIWFFEYGKGFVGPRVLDGDNIGATSRDRAHHSTFLHPKVEFFAPSPKHGASGWLFKERGTPELEHVGLESIRFNFGIEHDHVLPLKKFLREVAIKASTWCQKKAHTY